MPRQARPDDERSRVLLRDLTGRVQPEPGAHLGHAHQRHREQPGLLVGQPGVLVDHLRDRLGALPGHPVDALADRDLVGQVGLEHQPEGALGARDVVVEHVHRRGHAQLVVVRRRQRVLGRLDDRVARTGRAARGRGRACPGSAGRAPAWRPRRARRCRPSPRRGSPGRRRPRGRTRAAGPAAHCAACGRLGASGPGSSSPAEAYSPVVPHLPHDGTARVADRRSGEHQGRTACSGVVRTRASPRRPT